MKRFRGHILCILTVRT